MPALSPTMEQGNIARWAVKEGSKVAPGDLIGEVETDKATIGWESTEDGVIAKILVPDGAQGIKVGSPVAVMVKSVKDVDAFKSFTLADAGAAAAPTSAPAPAPVPAPAPASATPSPRPTSAPVAASGVKQPKRLLKMPALSPSMETGKIASWTKKEGDKIDMADMIAEVETDKATVAFESTEEGFLAKILVPQGSSVHVGSPIGIIVSKKEEISEWASFTVDMLSGAPAPAAQAAPSPAAAPAAATPAAFASAGAPSSGRVVASPRARMEAEKLGVNLSALQGTGPGGRIIAADVREYVPPVTQVTPKPQTTPPQAAPQAAPIAASAGAFVDLPHSTIRRITAQRLTESKQQIPHYYLTVECRVDALSALRNKLNALAEKGKDGQPAYKLSLNDFIIKAAALALKAVPAVNSEWRADAIRQYNDVAINVAVNTSRGLLTPVIRNPDLLGLKAINAGVRDAATRAQQGKSTLDELQPGTFTISNLGMFGIKQFAAVILPPQAAILAVGTTEERAVWKDGAPEKASFMTVTLSCDHRVVDGAIGAQWLAAFRELVENPVKLML